MNRRQILKTLALAPFVGLFKPKEKKKLELEAKMGETVVVPEGQTWEIQNIVITSATSSISGSYIINGHIIG